MSDSRTQPVHDPIQGEIIHEYDGIQEADNALPRWWLFIFGATVVFALGYWLLYHTYGWAPLTHDSWAADVAAQAERGGGPVDDATLAALADDDATVSRGQDLYTRNCIACHGDRGEGRIGPNLTDAFWIHGGGPVAIHDVIRDGVAAKGMPTWGPQLGPGGLRAVTAFVLTQRDRDLPGRPPEGERFEP